MVATRRALTVQLDPDKVAQMVIRVLQEDPTGAVGPEVEGDVSTVARSECGEGHVGGLSDGDGVPDASFERGPIEEAVLPSDSKQ